MRKEIPAGAKLAIPLLLLIVSFNAPMFIRLVYETENNSFLSTTVKLILLSIFLFWLLPKVIGIPSRENKQGNLIDIGLVKWPISIHSIWLGVLLGFISLTFMLIGSAITGGYTFDLSTLELNHVYFSLVPGIFEEVVFRGFIMVVAIQFFKSYKKAVIFQVVIFTLSHLKDFSGWGIVDMLTVAVIAIAFTYVVLKSGHLYTAMIFHFIHDAFLFVVQKKDGLETFIEHLAFYTFVWIGMIVIMLVTKYMSNKYNLSEKGKYIRTNTVE